jgi:myo-inositol-1(or 4)-monophosphatase
VGQGHDNPVCEADLAVDAFLHEALALVPQAGWLSEETVDDPVRLDHGLCWVVDPVDGTRDFVRGRPGWAVSVALVEAGRPIAAMLAAPARAKSGWPRPGRGRPATACRWWPASAWT